MEAGIKIQNRHRVAAAAENFETRLTADAAETATTAAAKLSSARATALRSWEQRQHGGELLRSFKATNVFIILNVDSVLLSVTFYNWFSDMGSILVSTLNINKLQCVNKRSKQFKPIFSPFFIESHVVIQKYIILPICHPKVISIAREGILRDFFR